MTDADEFAGATPGPWDSNTWHAAAELVARTLASFRLGDVADPYLYNDDEKLRAGHIVGALDANNLLRAAAPRLLAKNAALRKPRQADEFAGATPGLDLSELDRVVNDSRYSSELVGLRVRNDWTAIYAALSENAALKAQVEEAKKSAALSGIMCDLAQLEVDDRNLKLVALRADRDRLAAELDQFEINAGKLADECTQHAATSIQLRRELEAARAALELFDALPLPDQTCSGDDSRRWIDRYNEARAAGRAALSTNAESRKPATEKNNG